MSEGQKAREEEVFSQELSADDFDAAAGGDCGNFARALGMGTEDADSENCVKDHKRNIYGGNGFPNCAATVEDGSWCGDNDACLKSAVLYRSSMVDPNCVKAWH